MTGSVEFENAVWADKGTYFVCFTQSGSFRTRAFSTPAEATAFAKAQSEIGDVWYAPAVFVPSADRRTANNVQSVRAFWLDVDVGDGKDYGSLEEAVSDARRFCKEAGLPKPTLVCSGYGLHLYWLLEAPLPAAAWKEYALQLKQLTKAHGFRADDSRTADAASLLRLPGTANWKSGSPVPVKLLLLSPPVTMDELPLDAPVPTPQMPIDNSAFEIPVEMPPVSAEKVADKCAQLAKMRDSKGVMPEPEWYACLGLLAFCDDGREKAHEWSSGYDGYDPRETDFKLDHWVEGAGGATTCSKFESLDPETCAGCPLRGKINSPIRLGIDLEPDETEPDETEWAAQIPPGWVCSPYGVYMNTDDGPERIIEDPIIVESVGRIGYTSSEAVVKWRTPQGRVHKSEMPLSSLVDDRSMTAWLLDRAITGFTKVRSVRMYLKDFIQEIQRKSEIDTIVNRFGWADGSHTAFFLGTREISERGVSECRLAATVHRKLSDGLQTKGDLEAWANATRVLAGAKMHPYAIALLTSAASPILSLVGVDGAVLSLAGKSGIGKTTAALFAMSFYGMPDALTLSPQGTLNSKGEFFRLANSLPLLIDDIISYARATSPLVYMAANGRAKERLTRNGEIKGQETWALSLITTTNTPLYDLPPTVLGDAEKRRVLEMQIAHAIPRKDAEYLHSVMRDNYGLAAEPYLRTLIAAKDKIIAQFPAVVNKIFDEGVGESFRFSVWLLAACKIAGDILAALGLISFDHKAAIKMAIKDLKSYTERSTVSPVEQVNEVIYSWINEHIGSVSVSTDKGFVFLPDRQILARAYSDEGTIAIPVKRAKEIIQGEGIPGTALTEWREEHVVDTKNIRLGGGRSVAERCYIVKLAEDIAIDLGASNA
ncbi:MAG: DUF927 domain-containing protein [Bacteroidetes bacterium]|nr:MAG: DUF927 domain-containing protein [Bacteroidota bacterium]